MVSLKSLFFYSVIFLSLVSLAVLIGAPALAQESTQKYFVHRIEIWALFYRLMVVAFVIGAVVMGVIGYVVWRFRESNKHNIPPSTSIQRSGEGHS